MYYKFILNFLLGLILVSIIMITAIFYNKFNKK